MYFGGWGMLLILVWFLLWKVGTLSKQCPLCVLPMMIWWDVCTRSASAQTRSSLSQPSLPCHRSKAGWDWALSTHFEFFLNVCFYSFLPFSSPKETDFHLKNLSYHSIKKNKKKVTTCLINCFFLNKNEWLFHFFLLVLVSVVVHFLSGFFFSHTFLLKCWICQISVSK